MIHLIVAIDNDGAIGRGGDLLEHIGADLRRFRRITMGNTLLMGRRTFESLPSGALPGRRNIVLTRDTAFSAPGIEVAHSLGQAVAMAADGPGDTFVIGGAQIYAAALPQAEVLHLTVIHGSHPDADTFFPVIPLDDYRIVEVDPQDGFSFVTLEKVK